MKRNFLAVLALAVCLVAPALMKADKNPNVGTWKLNPSNSNYIGDTARKA